MSMTSMTQLVKRRPVAGHFGGLDGGLRKWWDHQQTAVTDINIESGNAAQNLFCLGWSRCIVTFLLVNKACKLWYHLERVRKERLKSSFYESNLNGFPVWQGLCFIFMFLTTWCGWFHMSNRPQSPSSWGESPRWLVGGGDGGLVLEAPRPGVCGEGLCSASAGDRILQAAHICSNTEYWNNAEQLHETEYCGNTECTLVQSGTSAFPWILLQQPSCLSYTFICLRVFVYLSWW